MSVLVTCDVGGHTLTLHLNGGQPIVMDIPTAYQVAHFLSITLDRLAQDHVAKAQKTLVDGAYRID